MSTAGGMEISEKDKIAHRQAEKDLREAKAQLAKQVKVLLLGSGDSGKSTILKVSVSSPYCVLELISVSTLQQMRLIHKVPFSPSEVESYRQLVFENLTRGLKSLLDAMFEMEITVSEDNMPYLDLIDNARDLRDGETFPDEFYPALKSLWDDAGVQEAWSRGNEAALPEK